MRFLPQTNAARPNHHQMHLRLLTAMMNGTQWYRIDTREPRECLCVYRVGFPTAFYDDELQLARVCHDYFMSKLG